MRVVEVSLLLLLPCAGVGCGESEPGRSTGPSPVAIPEVVEMETQLLPPPADDSAKKSVDLQRRELREAQQLLEQVERELGEIRDQLESSNRELRLKREAVDAIQIDISE